MEKKNNLDPQYNNLLKDILEKGIKKQTRNGEVLSMFGRQIRHNMSDGFPLLTGKKMFFKGIITELLWFLRGDTNIKYLVDNGCNIWDGDAYKNYLNKNMFLPNPKWLKETEDGEYDLLDKEEFINKIKTDDEFAKKWGELGPIYGKQWRRWGIEWEDTESIKYIDQIQNLINDLKTNPDSRRLMVNAWNVGELDQMVLPPCHYGFQVYTRELTWAERVNLVGYVKTEDIHEDWLEKYNVPKRAISLMWNQRSVDAFLGLPFNIASYGLLLKIIAKEVNMVPDELIGNLGDVHLYSNHIEQAKEQLTREPFQLPKLKIKQHSIDEPSPLTKPQYWHPDDFVVENYQSHPTIKAPLSN
jgi:thymidylate synthase